MENNEKPRWRLVKTDNPPFWVKPLVPVLALIVTLFSPLF